MAEQWRVTGDFIDFCKCAVPCPCSWGQPPTEGDCQGIVAWRIREGNYGDAKLDGLAVAGVAEFEGTSGMRTSRCRPVCSSKRSADDVQREALQTIFGGQAGSWPRRSPRALSAT